MSKPTDRILELVYKIHKANTKRELLRTKNFTLVSEMMQRILVDMGISKEESYRVAEELTKEANDELKLEGTSPFIDAPAHR